jgi:hypothetical protein
MPPVLMMWAACLSRQGYGLVLICKKLTPESQQLQNHGMITVSGISNETNPNVSPDRLNLLLTDEIFGLKATRSENIKRCCIDFLAFVFWV